MAYYRKKQLQELVDWTPDFPMTLVSVSEADKSNGSPKKGDKIAYNPKDPTDIWLVGKQYFDDNYEFVSQNKEFLRDKIRLPTPQEAVTVDKFDVMDVNLKQREEIDFLKSRIEMLKSQVLYVVEMLRWGDREQHSYVIGVFDNEVQAKQCGEIERSWRGGKYEYEIKSIALNDFDDESGEKYENHEQTKKKGV